MFQFHQNNSQLLFHIIVSLWGAGAFSRDFTTNLARRCRAFTRALKNEKLKAPPFPGPGGAGDTNDWCIILQSFSKCEALSARNMLLRVRIHVCIWILPQSCKAHKRLKMSSQNTGSCVTISERNQKTNPTLAT